MTFLPENYQPNTATKGTYLKFRDGTTKFRILSEKAVTGYVYWTNLNKPVRVREQPKTEPDNIRIDEKTGKPEKIKHFWVMVVYDYASEQPCVLEITQATIQRAIHALFQDTDWGHPNRYDIKVTRSGSGIDTEYTVAPVPHKEFDFTQAEGWEKINLEALFDAGDPFSNGNGAASNGNGNGGAHDLEYKALGFNGQSHFVKAWERFEAINAEAAYLGLDLHPDASSTTLEQLTAIAQGVKEGVEEAKNAIVF